MFVKVVVELAVTVMSLVSAKVPAVEGNVTVVQNYCATTTNGYYKVNLKEVNGVYKVEELEFDEGL